jgi:hypothetical protein
MERAGWLSTMLFTFLNPLIETGRVRPLEEEDVDPLPSYELANRVFDRFNASWDRELQRARRNKTQPSLFWALWAAFGTRWYCGATLQLLWIPIQFIYPFLVEALVKSYTDPDANFWHQFAYAMGLFLSVVMNTFLINGRFYHSFRLGSTARSATMSAIYNKSLTLNSASRQASTTGESGKLLSDFSF